LIKLRVGPDQQAEILQAITSLHARIIDSYKEVWILEVTGDAHSVDNAFNILSAYTIVESIRTGKIAIERSSAKE
jgi:acetolactate synthase I/III small subunit